MPALAAMAAIQGISAIVAAKKKADAAKQAGTIQQQAANKATAVNQGVYQQQMAGMEPYAAAGRQSMNSLSRLMNPGISYTPQMQQADARAQVNAPPPWAMLPGGSWTAPDGGAGAAQLAQSAPGQGTVGNLSQQMVTLRAPNGSVRAVPANQVDDFLRKGAQRV